MFPMQPIRATQLVRLAPNDRLRSDPNSSAALSREKHPKRRQARSPLRVDINDFTPFTKSLDFSHGLFHYLTMVKNEPATSKGEQTRKHILQTALDLFREKGFDATSMQDVASQADVAKSAAYYYFPGKEAIIQAYYETVQADQERICGEVFRHTEKLKDRLRSAMHSKLDLARNDRNLLGVVFRYTGEPGHPLSCLGKGTAKIRRRSIDLFRDAIAREKLPEDLDLLLPVALWALQMGLLVMFLYDGSPEQRRTRRLADGALDLTLKLLTLAKLPILKPVRTRILALLREAELLPAV
jgi:AcrR family transcriptional regulator